MWPLHNCFYKFIVFDYGNKLLARLCSVYAVRMMDLCILCFVKPHYVPQRTVEVTQNTNKISRLWILFFRLSSESFRMIHHFSKRLFTCFFTFQQLLNDLKRCRRRRSSEMKHVVWDFTVALNFDLLNHELFC